MGPSAKRWTDLDRALRVFGNAVLDGLRATLRPDDRKVFVCWRDYSDNPWLS